MVDPELAALGAMRDAIEMAEEPTRHYDGGEAKAILKAAGWSAESAARVLGVSVRTLQGWLANEHSPRDAVAERWQKLLSLLERAAAVRSTRLQEGVERLLSEVRRSGEVGAAA